MDFSFDAGGPIGAAISTIGNLAVAAGSSDDAKVAAKKQYEYNTLLQEQANKFTAQQSQINRDFQERLSNTAYQRQKADLVAAGYNPLLAINGGGASTPAGSSGSGVGSSVSAVSPSFYPDLSHISSALKGAVVAQYKKQNEKVDAEKDNIKADTMNKKVGMFGQILDGLSSLATPLLSGYGAKKGVEIATKTLSKAGIRNAKPFVEAAMKSSPSASTALGAASALQKFGLLAAPLTLGAGTATLMKKAQDEARSKGRTSFTHHMSAGW